MHQLYIENQVIMLHATLELEKEMMQTTVCFLLKNSPQKEVLLGFKKAGFGAEKYVG